ncbi:MAG: hypothetical protein LBC17_01130 [Lactobacillaceae bacterium]|jgi:hypothetical protein|nr:hypothetical protein [Lactobacillaceae bacterium]
MENNKVDLKFIFVAIVSNLLFLVYFLFIDKIHLNYFLKLFLYLVSFLSPYFFYAGKERKNLGFKYIFFFGPALIIFFIHINLN